MNKLIFLCIASGILLLSIIVVNIAPSINGILEYNNNISWMQISCKSLSDKRKFDKEKDLSHFSNEQKNKDESLRGQKKGIDRCNRRQAMIGLEYAAFNINIVLGGICALLGLLHYYGVGSLGRLIGFFGLGCGAVGFVLTLVYVIESGLVFNDIDDNMVIRVDKDGAFAKWDGSKYTCIYYNKKLDYDTDKKDKLFLRFSDYGSKTLSYKKYFSQDDESETHYKYIDCEHSISSSILSYCIDLDEKTTTSTQRPYNDKNGKELGKCEKLYAFPLPDFKTNKYKILYDRWLTTIILSCLIFLLNIGLAIFGFLLFNDSNGLSGTVSIK